MTAPSSTSRNCETPSAAPGDWRAVRPMDLEPYYCHWVNKLTADDLHAKSDIATVLALLHRELDDVKADYLRVHKEKNDLLFALSETGFSGDIRSVFKDEDADRAGVARFSEAMLAKLTKKRAEGRGGWNKPEQCTVDFLRELLLEHVRKGDPVDIANLAMMIWNRTTPLGLLPRETNNV